MRRILLDRLAIRLNGVARPVAEAALDGLGEELGRHLAGLPVSALPTRDVRDVSLRGEERTNVRDAAALREALARRIVAGLSAGRPMVLMEAAEETP
jgi:hypothetical protein